LRIGGWWLLKNIRVLLIEDSEIVRRKVRGILGEEGVVEVVGECLSVEEAILRMVVLRPDVVLIDTRLPEIDLIKATSSLKGSSLDKGIDVIFLADSSDYWVDALKAGATGYLLKDMKSADFRRAIMQVYSDSHPLETESPVEEIIELIVLPPTSNIVLVNFMYRLGSVLDDDFASIVCTVGSWDKGSVITVRSKRTRSFCLETELAHIPEVEKVEEEALTEDASSGLSRKAEFLPRLGIKPDRRLLVTLGE
jgi:CheY-like chemotaxis protein